MSGPTAGELRKTGVFEVVDTTAMLLDEINCPNMTRRDVAQSYALAIASSDPTDWKKVNAAIVSRWSEAARDYIKRLAWSGECWPDDAMDGNDQTP